MIEPLLAAMERDAGDDRRGRTNKKAIELIRMHLTHVIQLIDSLV